MLRMEYVTMIPTEVFDCFAQGDYIPLMAQAAMEHGGSAHESLINSSRRPPTGIDLAISFSLRLLG